MSIASAGKTIVSRTFARQIVELGWRWIIAYSIFFYPFSKICMIPCSVEKILNFLFCYQELSNADD